MPQAWEAVGGLDAKDPSGISGRDRLLIAPAKAYSASMNG